MVNDDLLDSSISHNVDAQAYSNYVVRRMLNILNKVDAALAIEIEKALSKAPSKLNIARLDALLKSVKKINAEAYNEFYKQLSLELNDLTQYESQYQLNLFKSTIPVELGFSNINVEQVYSAAMSQPFQGRLLSQWADSLADGKLQHIKDAIAIGYVENETVAQIVKRIVGTKSLKYSDGLIDIDRRHAESVVRTAISHTANFTRDRFFEKNESLIKGYRFTATLDSKTTPFCRAHDNKFYLVGQNKPSLPHHFNERSIYVAVVKSFKELGLDIDEFPSSTRSSLDGQIPDDISYEQWLKKKHASFQDEVLGKSKAKLFRNGGLSLDRFINRQGREYTLDELRIRDTKAFEKAGL